MNSSGLALWAKSSWIVRKVSLNSSRGKEISLVSVTCMKNGLEDLFMWFLLDETDGEYISAFMRG
jgi:hypothetical protein